MLDYQKCVVEAFTGELASAYRENYGTMKPEYGSIIALEISG